LCEREAKGKKKKTQGEAHLNCVMQIYSHYPAYIMVTDLQVKAGIDVRSANFYWKD